MNHTPIISTFVSYCIRKLQIPLALTLSVVMVLSLVTSSVLASATSNFAFSVNPGTLAVDIVDASYVTVGSPSVALSTATFSFACQAVTGTFGTATQVIYVKNPDAADSGWTIALAASAPTAFWDSAGTDVDFNDATTSGCTDGADADTLKGQLTVDASVGTLAVGTCATCATTSITKGSSAAYVQATTDSITLLTAAAGSNDIGDWKLTGVSLSQTIPAELPAASDYNVDMTLSVTAS